MSKFRIIMATLLAVALAVPAMAADFKVSGDLNNRFLLYTDQAGFFTLDNPAAVLDTDDNRNDSFASIKYRMTAEASTNDGKVKGVYGIELGAIRFGNAARGGGFSGDGVNIETRFAYTDFQLPGVASKARVRIGLQPWSVNPFFWNETATAVTFMTDNLTLGWARPKDALTGANQDWGDGDLDSLLARYEHKGENYKAGIFANYTFEDTANDFADFGGVNPGASDFTTTKALIANYQVKKLPEAQFDLITVGTDGSYTFGNMFVNWDLMYEDGTISDASFDGGVTSDDIDISAYLLHGDIGANFGPTRLTLTSYYASGDDGEDTDSTNAFISVDIDRFDSIIIQEAGYTDDYYFTERDHLGPFGLWLTKLAVDQKVSKQLTAGASVIYMQTAEDVPLANGDDDNKIGTEIDAYVSYKLYDNVEFAINAGYLFAGDVMDVYETGDDAGDGSSDVDIFRSTARVRYSF